MEKLLDNPFAFASGCIVWVPLAIWIVVLLGWMITGEIDALIGIVGVMIALAMGYLGINPPSPILPPLLFTAALSTLVIWPIAQVSLNRVALRTIDLESLDSAYEMLSMRRDNIGAALRVAKAMANLGYIGHAAAIAEKALEGADRRIFREELFQLRSWKERARDPRVPRVHQIQCIHCSLYNEVANVFCARCGGQILSDYARGKWMKPGLKSKLLVAWLAGILCVVAVPALASSLPPAAAILAIAATLIVGAAILIVSWRRAGEQD